MKLKLTLLQLFSMGLTANSKSTYIKNIFLRLLKNIPVFLSLLSFSVLVMYVSMERLHAAKFAAALYGAKVFSNMLITFFISCQNYTGFE